MQIFLFMKYESKCQQLISRKQYYKRLSKNIVVALLVTTFFWSLGAVGFFILGTPDITDAYYNAAMLMTGMGPTTPNPSDELKWFASIYALLSGVVYLSTIGLILAPIVHRFMHQFNLEEEG